MSPAKEIPVERWRQQQQRLAIESDSTQDDGDRGRGASCIQWLNQSSFFFFFLVLTSPVFIVLNDHEIKLVCLEVFSLIIWACVITGDDVGLPGCYKIG